MRSRDPVVSCCIREGRGGGNNREMPLTPRIPEYDKKQRKETDGNTRKHELDSLKVY
jgi:hypothetical protein